MSLNYHVIWNIFLLLKCHSFALHANAENNNKNWILIEYHKCIYTTYRLLTHTRTHGLDFHAFGATTYVSGNMWMNAHKNINNNQSQVNITACQLHSWLLMILLEIEHKLMISNTEKIDKKVQSFQWAKIQQTLTFDALWVTECLNRNCICGKLLNKKNNFPNISNQ